MTTIYTGTGRRKRAVARVFIKPGSGKFIVNKRELTEYFCNNLAFLEAIKEPLVRTNNLNKFDIVVSVFGGGIKGQSDAIKLGLARALLRFNLSHRAPLKAAGLFTRDAREVERKHYYKRKARKSPQYSKR